MHPLHTYLCRFVPALTTADWQLLAPDVRPRHLERGQHFVQAGEDRPELALVLRGDLRLYYPRPNGEERSRCCCWLARCSSFTAPLTGYSATASNTPPASATRTWAGWARTRTFS